MRLRIGRARANRWRLSPGLGIRRVEPSRGSPDLVQGCLLAGRLEGRSVQLLQSLAGGLIGGECLARMAVGVVKVADQAKDDGAIDGRQSGALDQADSRAAALSMFAR